MFGCGGAQWSPPKVGRKTVLGSIPFGGFIKNLGGKVCLSILLVTQPWVNRARIPNNSVGWKQEVNLPNTEQRCSTDSGLYSHRIRKAYSSVTTANEGQWKSCWSKLMLQVLCPKEEKNCWCWHIMQSISWKTKKVNKTAWTLLRVDLKRWQSYWGNCLMPLKFFLDSWNSIFLRN